ncbi:hypothetical protein VTK73DRAFT_5668 [Phialemonium thermophilum]|uniref:Uncharacterized protein n=1 Tax=Phialemonium thermophilum TaxID=223376 RepID=A0ABR3V122_9PEZI
MPVYEGVETNVSAAISTINLVVTRRTLLTLLDFVLVTFTNGGEGGAAGEQQQLQRIDEEEDADSAVDVEGVSSQQHPKPNPSPNGGAIRVKVDLKSIRMILNNDGIRLATLSFNHAEVGVFLLGRTMRVSTRLGDLSLVDDVNQGVSARSALRQLVTIRGDELADFRYETWDRAAAQDTTTPGLHPGYDSSVYLRAGSVQVNFVEEPFRKLVDFVVQFGKMQALYNAARQAAASQASQLQQSRSRVQFDVLVRTPIVVFPRLSEAQPQPQRDVLTAYLGEIYALNKFAPLDDAAASETAMLVTAGIRNIRLTSLFHYPGATAEDESRTTRARRSGGGPTGRCEAA